MRQVNPKVIEQADSREEQRLQRVQQAFTLFQYQSIKLIHTSKLWLSKEC